MNANEPAATVNKEDDLTWWYLRLYIAGKSSRSVHASANLKRLCDEHLAGHYEIEIIDLVERPSLARGDDILAIPTLVRRLPKPQRRIVGDLSDTKRVLAGLQIETAFSG